MRDYNRIFIPGSGSAVVRRRCELPALTFGDRFDKATLLDLAQQVTAYEAVVVSGPGSLRADQMEPSSELPYNSR